MPDSFAHSGALTNNVAMRRFEMMFGENMAYGDYHIEGAQLFIDYVFAPETLRGTGAAGKLMAAIMDYGAEHDLTLVPVCGYAAAWMKRNAARG
jgi:hypothetical protein